MALVGASAVIITVTMVRTTSLTVWRLIGLKLMGVVVAPQHCTPCLALVVVLAITGVAAPLTVLEVRPST
jgi:hypothetical protein